MPISAKRTLRQSLLMAFFIPVIAMLIVMITRGCTPFGDKSMLYSDMYHQYYPFWVEFRRMLHSGGSALYTWSVGLGMDYLSLISYYLASPLNLLAVLVPEEWTLQAFSMLVPIKLGLASLFFAIFLNRCFHRQDVSISLFSGFYGLCAWALGYSWNVMWLDTFALLPLMVLGTVRLLRDKRFVLYTLVLFLSIYANYYIGLFVCIFVLLTFICWQICCWSGWKRFCGDFVRIGFFTVVAIGMTCIITLPALAGLQNTQSSVNSFPTGFRLNIASENTVAGLLDAMGQIAGNTLGGTQPSWKEGLPNVYCGVGSMVLAFLLLTHREIRLREKVCSVVLLIFFMLSFIIRQLDYIWHGFHFTNMIPYRFSFLFSFVVLVMAYRAYLLRGTFRPWQLAVSGGLCVALMALSNDVDQWPYLLFNIGFLTLYLVSLSLDLAPKPQPIPAEGEEASALPVQKPRDSRTAATVLSLVMVLEIAMNMLNFGIRFATTTVSNYPKGTEDTEAVLEYMEERESDTLFYRAEVTHTQTLNDGALNGYNGIGTFTSSANVRTTVFMRALGFGAKNTYNRYAYEESSPVANLFLGLKYMIERDGNVEDNACFNTVYSSGNVYLLENNAYLPLGFLVRQELAEVDFFGSIHFDLQNEIFSAATGTDADVWNPVRDPDITATGVSIDSKGEYVCYYSAATGGSEIVYTFTAMDNGFLCLYFDVTDRNSYKVYRNGELLYSESLSLPQMIAASDVVAGDEIQVVLTCKDGESGNMSVRAAILDSSVFRDGYTDLSGSTWELTHFEDTLVEGTIDCGYDGLMYTSIPQDGNWTVYVDGVETEPTLIGDCMIAVPVSQGSHSVRFEYRNGAFSLGWKISAGCALVLLCAAMLRKKKRGKYERKK